MTHQEIEELTIDGQVDLQKDTEIFFTAKGGNHKIDFDSVMWAYLVMALDGDDPIEAQDTLVDGVEPFIYEYIINNENSWKAWEV